MGKPILEIKSSKPLTNEAAKRVRDIVVNIVSDDYYVLFVDNEFSLSIKDDSIASELRAIKATLTALAIKVGAISNPSLTGDDIHDAISKSISRQLNQNSNNGTDI